jgi:hypothetical protein
LFATVQPGTAVPIAHREGDAGKAVAALGARQGALLLELPFITILVSVAGTS